MFGETRKIGQKLAPQIYTCCKAMQAQFEYEVCQCFEMLKFISTQLRHHLFFGTSIVVLWTVFNWNFLVSVLSWTDIKCWSSNKKVCKWKSMKRSFEVFAVCFVYFVVFFKRAVFCWKMMLKTTKRHNIRAFPNSNVDDSQGLLSKAKQFCVRWIRSRRNNGSQCLSLNPVPVRCGRWHLPTCYEAVTLVRILRL